jgi:hypothetical protein
MTGNPSTIAPEAPERPRTGENAAADAAAHERNDQLPVPTAYGHGRMPLFMKLLWTAFLVFATWYVITFLLDAVALETR